MDEEKGLGCEYAKLGLEDSQKGVVLQREQMVAVPILHLHANPRQILSHTEILYRYRLSGLRF